MSKSYTLEAGAGGQQTLQTDGINVRGVWPCQDLVDVHRLSTNSPAAMLAAYGVEACRATIVKEVRPLVCASPSCLPAACVLACVPGLTMLQPTACSAASPPAPAAQVSGVFGAYGIGVDPRHLSLIADFMTHLVRGLAVGWPAAVTECSPLPLAAAAWPPASPALPRP